MKEKKVKKYFIKNNKKQLFKKFLKNKKNKNLKRAYKIKKDKLYSQLYKKTKSIKKIKKAGFFFDKIKIKKEKEENKIFISTPVNKLKKLSKTKQNIVLITTGAFSPLHKGHILMMEKAKEKMISKGYNVLGGYISPSHDEYVNKKNNGTASFNIGKRIFLIEKILEKHWLMVDKWESYYNKKAINFTEVIYHLEEYLNKYYKTKKIKIIYVFGDDNKKFQKVFQDTKYNSICIQRKKKKLKTNQNTIFIKHNKKEIKKISSTKIREKKIKNIEDKLYNQLKKQSKEKILNYYLRNDIKKEEIIFKFQKIIRKNHKKNQINFHIENLSSQKKLIKLITKKTKTISLDKQIKGTYNINVSRKFNIATSQEKSNNRLISKNISKIPSGKYILIEDDVETGGTIKKVLKKFHKGIKIKKIIILNKLLNKNKYNEVLDLRDFIIGEKHGGLKVLYKNKIVRVPYVLPYVSPTARAKIPYNKELQFSKMIWKLNKKLYKKKKVKEIKNKEFKKLLLKIGFKEEDKITKICKFHLKKLKN